MKMMAGTKASSLAVSIFLLWGLASASKLSSNVAPYSLTSIDTGIDTGIDGDDESITDADMEKAFTRSEEEHNRSMIQISRSMTEDKAMDLFQKLPNASDIQEVVASLLGGGSKLSKSSLRKKKQPSGYSGIDGARHMLNEMIFESMEKYDEEIAKCTEFYSTQCALMEIARGQISAANYVAANSRALILDSQGTINLCETAIPEVKQELKDHNMKCKHELQQLNNRLKIVMGDIAVMTMILKMTDCDAPAKSFIGTKKLVAMQKLVMMKCKDQCTDKSYMTFNHKALQKLINKLAHPVSLGMLQDSFGDMFDANAPLQTVTMVQVGNSDFQQPVVNKTDFNNPPLPRTQVPGNPCKDPDKGAPSAADKRAAKCTLSAGPNCYKLQSRFLAIQGGIADERDKLLDDISDLETNCEEQKNTLETVIANDQSQLSSAQTKLAMATEKESSAGEEARQTAIMNDGYHKELKKQMKTCSTNYIAFETELCALKKIRGELYKLKGSGHSAFFQDCEVSKWAPEECSEVCQLKGGPEGRQKLIRSVLTGRNGGSKCLPLSAERSCNRHPCPVDCKLAQWSGWSKCSAKCGGGVQQRLREVKLAMKHAGKPCGAVSQTKPCAIEACEKNCELDEWTKWTGCSKDCDVGTKKRVKFIRKPAEGSGKCPDKWGEERLEYEECNKNRCVVDGTNAATLTCNTTMDVMILIDGCPKTGKKGFAAQIQSANNLVDAFTDVSTPLFSIISYCGPRTWSGVSQCAGKSTNDVDMEKTCKIKNEMHFDINNKKKDVHNVLNGIKYERGTKLTALGLLAAKAELTLGRKESASIVVTFQDGQPLSFRKTRLAARSLRKKARLLFVVVSKFAPLKSVKEWVTRRWQENLVEVETEEELGSPDTISAVVADICPTAIPKLVLDATVEKTFAELQMPK